jgi:hypothetical protein
MVPIIAVSAKDLSRILDMNQYFEGLGVLFSHGEAG